MADAKKTTFRGRAKSWAAKQGLHGPQAFFRFVIFTYLDCLTQESDEFVFKGGNLLWLYIHTPRETIDLDLVTRRLKTTAKVEPLLARANRHAEGIKFKVLSIKDITAEGSAGAAVVIEYSTEDGATNKFDLDIVYVLPTKTTTVASPLAERGAIQAATLENIIADKVAACHRFGGGNTRMKDYDDLWRIAVKSPPVDWQIVKQLLAERSFPPVLSPEWVNEETSGNWKRHVRSYKDLPRVLAAVMKDINRWLTL